MKKKSKLRNRLLDFRFKLKFKYQKDFAEFLGVHRYQYSKYENNVEQPSVEVLYRIAQKIGCHMEELIYIEDDEKCKEKP